MSLVDHLEKLLYFRRLVKHKSIKSGSQVIGISQAGLSKSMSTLEEALNVQLIKRSSQGLQITKEGELVLEATEKMFATINSIESRLRALQRVSAPHRFRIGMYDSIAVYLFPDLFDYLSEIYPNVHVELLVHSSSELKSAVKEGRIEIAVGVNLDDHQLTELEYLPLFEDYFGFFIAPGIQESLTEKPLIFHPDARDEQGKSVETYLKKISSGRSNHLVHNFETIKLLTRQRVGVGVLPIRVAGPLTARKELVQISLDKFKSTFGKHTIGILTSKSFVKKNQVFMDDIFRISEAWSKG